MILKKKNNISYLCLYGGTMGGKRIETAYLPVSRKGLCSMVQRELVAVKFETQLCKLQLIPP